MPVTGEPVFNEDARASWFSHKAEVAKPYYYSVYLADHDVTTEIAPTSRAAMFRFSFPTTEDAYVIVDAFDRGSYAKIEPGQKKITGYTTRNSGGVPQNFKNYFVIEFDQPFTEVSAVSDAEIKKEKQKHRAATAALSYASPLAKANPFTPAWLRRSSAPSRLSATFRNLAKIRSTR